LILAGIHFLNYSGFTHNTLFFFVVGHIKIH
jgi:hypothetical protein